MKDTKTRKATVVISCVAVVAIMFLLIAAGLSGCNKSLIDTTYHYDYAVLVKPNGEIVEGEVQSWDDYEGDQIQVKIDGVTYLVHSSDVCLESR